MWKHVGLENMTFDRHLMSLPLTFGPTREIERDLHFRALLEHEGLLCHVQLDYTSEFQERGFCDKTVEVVTQIDKSIKPP